MKKFLKTSHDGVKVHEGDTIYLVIGKSLKVDAIRKSFVYKATEGNVNKPGEVVFCSLDKAEKYMLNWYNTAPIQV